jgi:MoaA/NifB/PqqE/SkfB family radical SAM enzyme
MNIRDFFHALVRPANPVPAVSSTAPIEKILTSLDTLPSAEYLMGLYQDLEETTSPPGRMHGIEINDSCNLDCAMCLTSSSQRSKGLMSLDLFEATVKAIKESRFISTNLHTVGEPLANKRLPDYLKILKKYDLPVNSISTNGLLLEKNLDTLFEYREQIGRIRLSIDGASKEVYEKIRLGGKWENLHRNLLRFVERNEQAENPFKVAVNSIISLDNFHEIAFIPHIFSHVAEPTAFSFHWIDSLSPENDYFINRSYFGPDYHLKVPCDLLWSNVYVTKNGQLTSCCRDYDGDLIFSKIGENSIIEAFNNPAIRKLRRLHLDNRPEALPDSCQNCFGVDPRFSTLINAIFHHFYSTLQYHPAYLQDRLNRIGPLLKSGKFQEIRSIILE